MLPLLVAVIPGLGLVCAPIACVVNALTQIIDFFLILIKHSGFAEHNLALAGNLEIAFMQDCSGKQTDAGTDRPVHDDVLGRIADLLSIQQAHAGSRRRAECSARHAFG